MLLRTQKYSSPAGTHFDLNSVKNMQRKKGRHAGLDWNGMEWIGMEWNGMEWMHVSTITCTERSMRKLKR